MVKPKVPQIVSSKSASFYSYVIIISVSLAMVAAGGSRGAFGVFFKPMADDLGWSSAEMSGTFSLSMIIEGIVSVISGRLSDRYGTRIVLIFSGLISATGFILMSQVNTMWQMYLIYGFAMGVGLGGIVIPVVTILARWFTSRRSLMTGISLAANGLGQLASPLVAYQLITAYNWRTSYIILGVAAFALVTIPALFLKGNRAQNMETVHRNPSSQEQSLKQDAASLTLNEALHTRLFWMMIIMLGCYAYSFLSVLVHTVPHAIEIGIPASIASTIMAVLGGATLIGRLVFGAIADKIGNRQTIMIGFMLILVSLLWLIPAREIWALFLFAVVCGLGLGCVSSSQSPLSAKYFGLKSHGSIFGTIGGGTVVLGSFGPLLTGYLFDITQSYQIAFIICAILSLVGLIVCLLLRPVQKQR